MKTSFVVGRLTEQHIGEGIARRLNQQAPSAVDDRLSALEAVFYASPRIAALLLVRFALCYWCANLNIAPSAAGFIPTSIWGRADDANTTLPVFVCLRSPVLVTILTSTPVQKIFSLGTALRNICSSLGTHETALGAGYFVVFTMLARIYTMNRQQARRQKERDDLLMSLILEKPKEVNDTQRQHREEDRRTANESRAMDVRVAMEARDQALNDNNSLILILVTLVQALPSLRSSMARLHADYTDLHKLYQEQNFVVNDTSDTVDIIVRTCLKPPSMLTDMLTDLL